MRRYVLLAALLCIPGSVGGSTVLAADATPAIPDLSGQWGRNMTYFEPPVSGPGPIAPIIRKVDGTIGVLEPCCAPGRASAGDYRSPILRPEAADAVRKYADLAFSGKVVPDLHTMCWPEPPPFVLALHFGVLILQEKSEITMVYLLHNTVRHVRLNEPHRTAAPSWQGDSVARYEDGALVIDTVGIKTSALSIVDSFGTPHTDAIHVVERYRLIDGNDAAETQRKHGAVPAATGTAYGRGLIDPDTAKKGLQVEFTVDDERVFTVPWRGVVTYRPVTGNWPESLCAENPVLLGSQAAVPVADRPDF